MNKDNWWQRLLFELKLRRVIRLGKKYRKLVDILEKEMFNEHI